MSLNPADPPRQPGTPSEEDLPPTGDEAESERRQTVTPLIWLALGIVAITLFVVALVLLHGVAPLPGPGK